MTLIPLIDESRLVSLVNDPQTTIGRWSDRAACAGTSLAADPYFPDDDESPPAEALDRCVVCAVAHECLATALIEESRDGLRFGWWGGSGPDELDAIALRVEFLTQQMERGRHHPAHLARTLRERKRTVASIAAELGCTERTVYRYLASTAA